MRESRLEATMSALEDAMSSWLGKVNTLRSLTRSRLTPIRGQLPILADACVNAASRSWLTFFYSELL